MDTMTRNDELIGRFEEQPFSISRTASIDTVSMGKAKHHIPVLLEVDVTAARAAIQKRAQSTGERISFTGWTVKCLAQAASENKRVHAMRRGRRRLVIFDDVDVSVVIYREVTGSAPPEYLPMPYIIRRANEKTLKQIHSEIRNAQEQPLAPGEQVIGTEPSKSFKPWMVRFFFSLPFFIRRRLIWNRLVKDPFYAKRMTGTVVVSSIGMYGKVGTGGIWAIPSTMVPLPVVLGSISRKPGFFGEHIEARELLSLTILFDHDVIDGAPVATFLQRLRDLMEDASFIEQWPPD